MLFERSSTVQPSERTLWMSIQPADAYGGVSFGYHIAAMLCRAFPYAGEQLVGRESVVFPENLFRSFAV